MRLFKSRYLTNVITLLGSALGAQLLALLFTPILTRLFSPEAFGYFNAFVSYSGIIGSFLFLSIELAIVKAHSSAELNRVFGLLLTVGGTFASVVLISFIYEPRFYSIFGFDKLFSIKYFVFVGIIFSAFNIVLTYLTTRLELFKIYAKTQVVFVLIRFVVTYSLFYFGVTTYGLIIGFLIPTLLNIGYLFYKTKCYSISPNRTVRSLKVTLVKYQDLILFNTPANFVNSLIINFPIIYILKAYGVEVAGIFGLAYRMILLPVSVANKAVGQVIYKKFVDKKDDTSYLINFTLKNLALLSLSLPIFVVLFLWGEYIFATIFGGDWQLSGRYAAIMSPYVFFSLIISPLSFYFVAFDKNKALIIINIFFLLLLFIGVNIFNNLKIEDFLVLYSGINIFYYVFILFFILSRLLISKRGSRVS